MWLFDQHITNVCVSAWAGFQWQETFYGSTLLDQWHLMAPHLLACDQELLIIMEICKAPTLRLKALNKHTHIMYIEMENVIKKKKCIYRQVFKHNYAKDACTHTHTRTHTHTHTHCKDWWEWKTMWFNWNILRREMFWLHPCWHMWPGASYTSTHDIWPVTSYQLRRNPCWHVLQKLAKHCFARLKAFSNSKFDPEREVKWSSSFTLIIGS